MSEFEPFKRVFIGSNDANYSIAGLPKLVHGEEVEITEEVALKLGVVSEEDFDMRVGIIPGDDGKPVSLFARPLQHVAQEAKKELAKEEKKAEKAEKKKGGE